MRRRSEREDHNRAARIDHRHAYQLRGHRRFAILNARFDALFSAQNTAQSARRYPLFANDIDFVPDSPSGT